MEPQGIKLDPETLKKLATAANGSLLPLLGPAGEVSGYYISATVGAKLAEQKRELDALWPPEEIARLEAELANDPRPDVPHETVLQWMREQ